MYERLENKRIVIGGIFSTRSGLQRGADLMLQQMREENITVFALDLTPDIGSPNNLERRDTLVIDDLDYIEFDTLIIHLNPPEYSVVINKMLSADLLRGVKKIGYWAWETTRPPASWHEGAKLCDEIWTPSDFVAQILRDDLDFDGAIKVVPHPVDLRPIRRLDQTERETLRRKYGFRRNDFVVGFTFSFASGYTRKNPQGVIDAFTAAFEPDDEVKLIIRCNESHYFPQLIEQLLHRASTDDRVRVTVNEKQPIPIEHFYNCLDTYMSLHRSEGYGLTIVEAVQSGLPVITTGWGLGSDISSRRGVNRVKHRLLVTASCESSIYTHVPGAVWSDPDISDAARLLREIRERRMSA